MLETGQASPVRPTARCSPPRARPRVLATVVSAKAAKPGQDFFPLTVNYQEKAFAAGRIPGGYFKREGRPSERETLISRLIDRPIRPLFPDGYRNETQVIVTVLSHDLENDPDILAMVAASAALTLSGVPFMGPVGGARVGYHQWRAQGQPDRRGDEDFRARPHRRRHRGRRADGRVRKPRSFPRRRCSRRSWPATRLPAGDRRDHPPGRTRRQGAARSVIADKTRGRKGGRRRSPKPNCAKPTRSPPSRSATPPSTRSRRRSTPRCSPKAAKPNSTSSKSAEAFHDAAGQGRALEHSRHGPPHRRPRREDRAPDRRRGRRPAAHPWLGALHARRDAGARRRDARHRRGRAICRLARGHL